MGSEKRTVLRSALDAATHAYVGMCPCDCGATVAAIVDIPGEEKETGKEVGRWIRDGYRVERITLVAMRDRPLRRCLNKKRPAKEGPAEQLIPIGLDVDTPKDGER